MNSNYSGEIFRKLKTLVFEAITTIEINIKSYISNVISSNYGIDDKIYFNSNNFETDTLSKDDYKFDEMKTHIEKSLQKQIRNNHPSISWYKKKYGFYPFWVISNILTLGTISKIYSKMKEKDRITISKIYNLPHDYLSSYLIHINLVRNICAHNDVLYRYKSINSLPQKIKKVKDEYLKYNILINQKTGRFERGTNDFLALIFIFKFMLPKEDYNLFKTQFLSIMNKLSSQVNSIVFDIILNEMGLDDNWKEIIKI